MNKPQSLVLDTHVWIWLMHGDKTLSPQSISLLEKVGQSGTLFISAISIWELATLVQKDRLKLRIPLHQWVQESLAKPGLELLPLSPEIAIESTLIASAFPGDPADRIIMASARLTRQPLMTRDSKILQQAKTGYLKVIEC